MMEQTVLMVGMAVQVQEVSSLSNKVCYSQQPILWMTAVHVHPHEHTRGNPDIHIKQVRLFESIATLVYHTQPEHFHSHSVCFFHRL